MMNILWILTIGSSDIQLESKAITKKKRKELEQPKRRETQQAWRYWYKPLQSYLRNGHENLTFEPMPISRDLEASYRIEARVLGMLYQYHQEHNDATDEKISTHDEIWSYLTFPLLDNFVDELNKEGRQQPDEIALILTDQSAIFTTKHERKEDSPYWQDTCCLEPILERYFQNKYPEAKILKFQQDAATEPRSITLKPEDNTQGLDNWNSVLELVRNEFKQLRNNTDKDNCDPEWIYASHQAGTPAISSAVQFSSLAMYGDRVSFLVSSERNLAKTQLIESPSYLQGLRREEAKGLLKRYDYAGVNDLVGQYLEHDDRVRLEAAILWNVAKFEAFAKKLRELSEPNFVDMVGKRLQTWWWIAYEESYLAIIRQTQGNIVEAFFHSFRAFEGVFASWGQSRFSQHIEVFKGVPCLNPSILDDTENPLAKVSVKKAKKAISDIKSTLEALSHKLQSEDAKITKDDRVEMNLRTLCNLFKAIHYADYNQNCKDLKIFWDDNKDINVSEKRNYIVHQVKGMMEPDLWEFWGVSSEQEWQARLLFFLNFIVKEDFPVGFATLEEASLMAKVHKELAAAISQL